jgi:hypothetical protein
MDLKQGSVVIYLFTIKKKSLPFAFLQMAIGRRIARAIPGVSFAKLMGTGTGKTFTPSDADLKQWAILFVADDFGVVDNSRFISGWRKRSSKVEVLHLNPISSHGKWSRREPFELKWRNSFGRTCCCYYESALEMVAGD